MRWRRARTRGAQLPVWYVALVPNSPASESANSVAATWADTPRLHSTNATPAGSDTRNATRWIRPRHRGFGGAVTGSVSIRTGYAAEPHPARATMVLPRPQVPGAFPVLTVHDLVVDVGGKRIVDRASFHVRPGDKVGLVGRNGAGKTTLLRVLGGAASPRAGVVRRADATGYLSQDPRSDAVPDDTTVMAHVLSGRGLDELQARLEKLRVAMEETPSSRNIEQFGATQEQFEGAGGYAAEAEVRKLAAGLGLREDRLDVTLGALSGGERRRVELVRILFGGSDLPLLDEPTNHLDADARTRLLKFLRAYRGGLLVVSHDLD